MLHDFSFHTLDELLATALATSCGSSTRPIIARTAKRSSVACRSAAPRPRRVNVGADEAWHHGVDCDAVRPCTAQGDGGCVRAHRGGWRGVALPATPFCGPAINA
jgi:hypothetical protein